MYVSLEARLQARAKIERANRNQSRLKKLIDLATKLPQAKIEYFGSELLPRDEPVVVLATHQNSHDAQAVCYSYLDATGQALNILLKSELDEIRLVGPLFRALGGLAVGRTTETFRRSQLEKPIAILRAGGSVAAMGEGERTYKGIIGPIKKGAIFMAKQAGVEIVTAGIYGDSPSSELMPEKYWPLIPRPLAVYFGSRTNPQDISESQEFYRRQLQSDYYTAKAFLERFKNHPKI